MSVLHSYCGQEGSAGFIDSKTFYPIGSRAVENFIAGVSAVFSNGGRTKDMPAV